MKKDLAIFEGHRIRRIYDEKTEIWWFSVVDITQVLTQQPDFQTRKYWNKRKERLVKEGGQSVTTCHRLKINPVDNLARKAGRLTDDHFRRRRERCPAQEDWLRRATRSGWLSFLKSAIPIQELFGRQP
jgi:hypothetical protein